MRSLFGYTVYILHGIFSASLKLNYQEFCVKEKKLKLNMATDLKQPFTSSDLYIPTSI